MIDAWDAGGGTAAPSGTRQLGAVEVEAANIAYDQWRSNVFAPPVCRT
jgi:hypothetical protein